MNSSTVEEASFARPNFRASTLGAAVAKRNIPVSPKAPGRPKAKAAIPAEFRRKRPMVPADRTKEQMLREAVCSDAPEEALRWISHHCRH